MAAISLAMTVLDPSDPTVLMWLVLLAFTTASATQDIAIDAYAVDIAEGRDAGAINGTRVSAARVALFVAGGGSVAASDLIGWPMVWVVLAVVFAALAGLAWFSPRIALESTDRLSFRPMLGWLFRWRMVPVAALVLLYKVGDSTLGRMVKPFWVDRGYSNAEIGLISITLGTWLTVLGALLGGWIVTPHRHHPGPAVAGPGSARLEPRLRCGREPRAAPMVNLRRLGHRELHPGPRHRRLPVAAHEPVRQGARRDAVRPAVGAVRTDPRRCWSLHRARRRGTRLRRLLCDHNRPRPARPGPDPVRATIRRTRGGHDASIRDLTGIRGRLGPRRHSLELSLWLALSLPLPLPLPLPLDSCCPAPVRSVTDTVSGGRGR
jgi:hypothetical protein